VNWLRILWVGLVAGVVFAILDALINANPMGARALAFYKPIARGQFRMPPDALIYILLAGILEIYLLGLVSGLLYKPRKTVS
jgi:hypothetical protein